MKATSHTSKLEPLFSTLTETEKNTHACRKLIDEIRAALTDPRIPTHFTIISQEYPPIKEAYAVSDALESVTNGMYNPEALADIAEISESSPLYYWQRLVYALIAFYQGDRDNMHQLIEEIPEGYPPSQLKEVLFHLTGAVSISEPTAAQRALIEKVEEDHSFIRSAVEQLKEYLEAGMEETFSETALLIIRDLAFNHSTAAKRLALTCMAAIGEETLPLFVEQLQTIFGETEGNRLVALSLMEENPEVSLLFWIRLILRSLIVEDISRETTLAHLSIVGDLADRVQQYLPTQDFPTEGPNGEEHRDYLERLSLLTRKLEDELNRRFPRIEGTTIDTFEEPLRRLREFMIEEPSLEFGEKKKNTENNGKRNSARKGTKASVPIQLELF